MPSTRKARRIGFFERGVRMDEISVSILFLIQGSQRQMSMGSAEQLTASTREPEGRPRLTTVLFVARVNRLTARALAFGNSLAADRFEAVAVTSDAAELEQLRRSWVSLGLPVPLVVAANDFDDWVRPAVRHVRSLLPGPNHAVVVLIPELVVRHWYQKFLHNRSGRRLKAALLEIPWVEVINVPLDLRAESDKEKRGPRAQHQRNRHTRSHEHHQGRG
jgi:hypothetical protein